MLLHLTRFKKPAALLAATTLASSLSACGSDGPPAVAEPSNSETSQTASTKPRVSLDDLTGLVGVNEMDGLIEFVDPKTGEVNASIAIAHIDPAWDEDEAAAARQSFSKDWRYVTWSIDASNSPESVEVAKLNPKSGAYEELFDIDGSDDGSFSKEATVYQNPRFSPDGKTLWMESMPEGGSTITLVSVPYASYTEGDEPTVSDLKFEFDYSDKSKTHEFWHFDATGKPVITRPDDASEVQANGEPSGDQPGASYWTDDSGAIVHAEIYDGQYSDCATLARYDNGDFLVAKCNDSVLTRVAIDPGAGTISFTEVVPQGADPVRTVVVSEDMSKALLKGDRGWFRAMLNEPGSEPQPLAYDSRDLDYQRDIVAWT